MPEIPCPICKKQLKLESGDPKAALAAYPSFPFCSKRCRLIDLGKWFDEEYKIDRPVLPDDLPDELDETL